MEQPLVTTTTLRDKFGISRKLAYSWYDILADAGLAHQQPDRPYGIKFYTQEAVRFLQCRKGKSGNPMWSGKRDALRAWLDAEVIER
jgi:hypothetical protein